jgi:hypothetical protein
MFNVCVCVCGLRGIRVFSPHTPVLSSVFPFPRRRGRNRGPAAHALLTRTPAAPRDAGIVARAGARIVPAGARGCAPGPAPAPGRAARTGGARQGGTGRP